MIRTTTVCCSLPEDTDRLALCDSGDITEAEASLEKARSVPPMPREGSLPEETRGRHAGWLAPVSSPQSAATIRGPCPFQSQEALLPALPQGWGADLGSWLWQAVGGLCCFSRCKTEL
ncbi:unnamed protein product [Symbiodinium pilosum]|uniref:Uncharacterized protein n=1 Tax=Symbiodinium pilosum TaxID=2952 RepID=A0A812Q3L6_SYMPI|nr:unnamed protein product [Symbiodinium pilosum]